MDPLTDESLMQKVQKGNLDASTLLYQRYKMPLLAFFINCTSDRAHAEDLVQVTFEKMLKYRSNFHNRGAFKSWLFSIARNALKDFYRHSENRKTAPIEDVNPVDKSPNAEEILIGEDRQRMLSMALDRLSNEKRELLALIKLRGMKYREVAELYNIKESTLKVNVFRSMKELKNHLENIISQQC